MDSENRDHFRTLAVSYKQRTGSSTERNAANSHSDRDPVYLLKRARMLFACYRKDEAADPEVYCAAVAAVLGDYPRDVIDYVTDPRTGLPSKQKFLPNIAEISSALSARADYLYRVLTYEERVAEQARLTAEWQALQVSERLQEAGRAWLDRSDPDAKQLTQQTKKQLSEAEKQALIEDAKATGRDIAKTRLSEEAMALMARQDRRYMDDIGDSC